MAVLRFTLASVLLAICFIENGSARIFEMDHSNDVEINIGGINEFMALYPDANIEQLQMQSKVRGRMNYTLGSRLNGKPMDSVYLINRFDFVRFVSDKVSNLSVVIQTHIRLKKKFLSHTDKMRRAYLGLDILTKNDDSPHLVWL